MDALALSIGYLVIATAALLFAMAVGLYLLERYNPISRAQRQVSRIVKQAKADMHTARPGP